MASVFESLKPVYQGKRILVVGLGLQGGGVGVARFFSGLGAKVTVTDKKTKDKLAASVKRLKGLSVIFHLGGHSAEDFTHADCIFKGPSVPWDLPELQAAESLNIPVEMEAAFFAKHSPSHLIGVTGTRGKTTTSFMIYQVMKQSRYPVHLGGNIPDISTIDYLKTTTSRDWIVLELPSWPLSGFHRKKISPHIGVFTNIYPDHLNYYSSMSDYLYDKKAIYRYQTPEDYLIAGRSLKEVIERDNPKSKTTYFSGQDFSSPFRFLKGDHNRENASAALHVARILHIPDEQSLPVLSGFRGLPFRQEQVGSIKNVIFVNDTTSTTPVATVRAIGAFSDKPIFLLLGGKSKNLPFDELTDKLQEVRRITLLKGSFTEEILPELKRHYRNKLSKIYDNMESAVLDAFSHATSLGEQAYVLLSPAATSFAMYQNEFERGKEFNKVVRRLAHRPS